jgi:hypothetical protein
MAPALACQALFYHERYVNHPGRQPPHCSPQLDRITQVSEFPDAQTHPASLRARDGVDTERHAAAPAGRDPIVLPNRRVSRRGAGSERGRSARGTDVHAPSTLRPRRPVFRRAL